MDPLIREWAIFLARCLEHRVPAQTFDTVAAQLYAKSPIRGRKLAALLLKPRSATASSLDPRIFIYCERLLALKKIDASDVLASAFQYSRDRPPRTAEEETGPKEDSSPWLNPPELEEVVLNRLHKAFETGERPVSSAEGLQTVAIVTRWMSAMVASHTNDSMIQAMAGIQQHPQSISIRNGLGMLVVGLVENVKILELLSKEQAKDVRKSFAQSLSTFIQFLTQTSTTLQIANRLELLQKEHGLHDKSISNINGDVGENHRLAVAALQIDAVMDLATINTRAGLYIFLNSLLVARPLIDDFKIVSYMLSRYKVDGQKLNMATDLITAAFDILANSMYRSESSQIMFSLKSFLVNKIPVLLRQLSFFHPITAEMSITQALNRVDPNAFPAFSQGFDDIIGNSSSLSDVRKDFLEACALHGLIPMNFVHRLLGEPPMHGPPGTKYIATDLVAQWKQNFDPAIALIDELVTLDGNAEPIVGALTMIIPQLCETQMTMHLKTLCNKISKSPQAMDVVLQFTTPASLLMPLCQFLDEWRYEETQGEYEPVYNEFGAILVLILAFVHRYNMTYIHLGIGHDSFVAQLLERGHHDIAPDEMTEEQGRHLGSWLQGLFASDKEALGNDVFASCRPQDFYLIVPTLFSQTVMACSAEVLTLDTVKGGLEYLHHTFLLPSLVGGLTWMASHAMKQTHQDLDVLMHVFHKLIRSPPTSDDANAMHSTILCIVSSRLEKCFQTLKRRHPTRTDIDPLLQAIGNNLGYERSAYASMAELEQWTNAPSNTVAGSLRQTMQNLSQWASVGTLQLEPTPPSYTHRQLFACIKILGVTKTLRAIADEVKAQTEAGNGAVALDIGVSLICAPLVENSVLPLEISLPMGQYPRTPTNLRDILRVEFDNAASVLATDPLYAEAIVRLHRRVETLLHDMSQTHNLPAVQALSIHDVDLNDLRSQNADFDKIFEDAAVATLAAAAADADLQPEQQQALERSLSEHLASGGSLDLSGMGVGVPGGAGMGNLPDLDLGDLGTQVGMDVGEDDDAWGLDFDNM